MPEASSNTKRGGTSSPFVLESIKLDAHPDGALLRLCAALERLRAIADEMEQIAASLPARTILGRRMKEMVL